MELIQTIVYASPIAALVSIVIIFKVDDLVEAFEAWVWA